MSFVRRPSSTSSVDSRVTWLTDSRAAALLPGKPYIDELLTYGPDTYAQLAGREFGRVVNFECDARLTDLLESFDLKTGPVFQSGRPRSWAARRRGRLPRGIALGGEKEKPGPRSSLKWSGPSMPMNR